MKQGDMDSGLTCRAQLPWLLSHRRLWCEKFMDRQSTVTSWTSFMRCSALIFARHGDGCYFCHPCTAACRLLFATRSDLIAFDCMASWSWSAMTERSRSGKVSMATMQSGLLLLRLLHRHAALSLFNYKPGTDPYGEHQGFDAAARAMRRHGLCCMPICPNG